MDFAFGGAGGGELGVGGAEGGAVGGGEVFVAGTEVVGVRDGGAGCGGEGG